MIALADAEDALTLFTEGIAGRYFHVKATSEFNPARLEIDAESSALTPDTLYLPEQIDYPDPAGYRVLAMEQLGLREFGSYQFRMETARARLPELNQAEPEAHTLRESDLTTFYRHAQFPILLKRLHAACEKFRVRQCLINRYPGFSSASAAIRAVPVYQHQPGAG